MNLSFTAPAGALASAVKYAARWIALKPTIPAHGGLLFDIPAMGDRLDIFGFSENATGRASLDVDSDDAGAFVVSGRLIDQLVATFPDKPVTFESDGSTVAVRCGRWSGTLPAMSESDYPSLPGLAPEIGAIDGGRLADAVQRVSVAASRDLTKQVELGGIHLAFDADAGTATLITFDNYRSVRVVIEWDPHPIEGPEFATSLPYAHVLADAVEAFAGSEGVAVGQDAGLLSLSTADRSLTTQSMDPARFWDPRLPALHDAERPESFRVQVKDLAGPLKRAALLGGPKDTLAVRLRLSTDLLTVGVTSDTAGAGDEEVDADYDGPDAEILVRVATLQGALHTTPGDTAEVGFFPGAAKPMLVTSPADSAWSHVLVPLKKMG